MTTQPKPRYQGCAILAYLSMAADACANGTTPEAVVRRHLDTHPALRRRGKAESQNGGKA